MGGTGDGRRKADRRIEYSPLPSQKAFHTSPSRFKGFSGPIGSGKSQALCHEAIRLTYLNPGRLGLIGAPTYPMLRDATQRTLIEILDQNRIPYEFNKSEMAIRLKDTDSRIILRAVDHFERLRGTNLAWFGVDELTYTTEDVWLRLEGRLRDPKASRLCGFAVWTPRGRDWVYQRFVAAPVDGYAVVLAKPFENRFLLDHVPDYYEALRRSYGDNLYQQDVLGNYTSSRDGLVYEAFERPEHVRPLQWDPHEPLMWALDFNVEPMCSVVAQRQRDEVHVIDEIVLHRSCTSAACEEFFRRYNGSAAKLQVYGDASGYRRQTAGSSDWETVRQFLGRKGVPVEMHVPKFNPPVRERVARMNGHLKNAAGERRLFIDPRCRELMKDLEQVKYRSNGDIDKDRDGARTHLSDALGYLITEEFRERTPMGEQPYRLI